MTQDGVLRKTLPRPGTKDDAELAQAAYDWYRDLKKEVRQAAGDQVERLERAMVNQRSWTADEFTTLFLQHPFMVHLARRLVWTAQVSTAGSAAGASGTATGGTQTPFRVAEDGTLADAEDEEFALPQDATVRLAHPLTVGTAALAAMSEVFGDYEILQPFEQLGRDVYALTDGERASGVTDRFENITVATTKIFGMEKRGWYRLAPEDAGIQPGFARDLPDGAVLVIYVGPGIIVGEPNVEGFAEQILGPATATSEELGWQQRHAPSASSLAGLDVVTASEILRDLVWLSA
ncbi:MAG: DUF4132 domain-containing protein [Galactobacter sp.]